MNKKTLLIIGAVVVIGIGVFALTRSPKAPYSLPAGSRPFKGNSQAAILVEEFSDFQCPACKRVVPLVIALQEKYGYQAKFVYRHFPLTQIHQYALRAAVASECANDQGKFSEYHDALFEGQSDFSTGFFSPAAEKLGLDMQEFNACLDGRVRLDVVQEDMNEGARRQVNATPTFFINGQKVPIDQLEAVLDALVKAL